MGSAAYRASFLDRIYKGFLKIYKGKIFLHTFSIITFQINYLGKISFRGCNTEVRKLLWTPERQPQCKTTSIEDYLNGRGPQLKKTSMEDDLNGRQP